MQLQLDLSEPMNNWKLIQVQKDLDKAIEELNKVKRSRSAFKGWVKKKGKA